MTFLTAPKAIRGSLCGFLRSRPREATQPVKTKLNRRFLTFNVGARRNSPSTHHHGDAWNARCKGSDDVTKDSERGAAAK